MNRLWQSVRVGSIAALALLCAACEPQVAERGHTDLKDKIGQITPNVSRKADVQSILGSPSSTSQFGDERWYYITATHQTQAFFEPEITDQQVVQVIFDEGGVVKDIRQYGKGDAKDVELTERTTPTSGAEYGFFEQLLGNIGKFNKQRDPLSSTTARGPGGSRR
jgi:outer membrane protein assembly factor BamE (lipoprotein component of BamABCDE complex)